MKDEWYKCFPIYMLSYLQNLEKEGKIKEAEDFADRFLSGRLVSQYKPFFFNDIHIDGVKIFTDPLDPDFCVEIRV